MEVLGILFLLIFTLAIIRIISVSRRNREEDNVGSIGSRRMLTFREFVNERHRIENLYNSQIEVKEQEIRKVEEEINEVKQEFIDKRQTLHENNHKNNYSEMYYVDRKDMMTSANSELDSLGTSYLFPKPIKEHPVFGFMLKLGFENAKLQPPDTQLDFAYECKNLPFQIDIMKAEWEKKKAMNFKVNNN
jgi:hypothetical protein